MRPGKLRHIALVSLLLLSPANSGGRADDGAVLTSRFRGIEAPAAELSWSLPTLRPGSADKHVTRKCQVYGHHAVLWSEDGGMYVDALEFRPRPAGMKAEDVCGDRYAGLRLRPKSDAATDYAASYGPVGVFGRFLVSVGDDEFGLVGWFAILDLDTGKVAFRSGYQPARGVTFEQGKEGPVLTYWSLLWDFDCIPRRGEAACWNAIRARHAIPSSVPQPDCEKAIASVPSMLTGEADRSAQIMVHVRVRGLSKQNVTYLPDRPACGATP